jgi:hypothetical protein
MMTKNYFTDEQLNAIHKEICRLEDLESGTSLPVHPLNNVETANLGRICNLAVKAAIGEPVGEYRIDYFNVDISKLNHNGKLYSVKELEN